MQFYEEDFHCMELVPVSQFQSEMCIYARQRSFSYIQFTHELSKPKRFTREKIMEWLPSSPDLNEIENLWPIVNMKLFKGRLVGFMTYQPFSVI